MKGFRKRAAAVALGVCMAAGAALGLAACDWVADDPAVSNPSDAGGGTLFDPEDPVTEPEGPSAGGSETEDPEQGGTEPEEPTTQPEEPEQGGETETEDPEQGGTAEPEDPEQGGTTEPEEPAPSGPSLDEIMAAHDTIYGYQVTADGRDFVRDESGDPITVFKHEELYETIMSVFRNKPLAEGSANSCYQSLYGLFSSFEDLFRNYNATEKVYTIASLCEYANPRTENDKTLKIFQIPMDLSSNSFSELETYLANMNFGLVWNTTVVYDYKFSNLDVTDKYFIENREYLDACVEIAVDESLNPQLILFEQEFVSNGTDMSGSYHTTPIHIVSLNGNSIQVLSKDIHSSSQRGNGWKQNIIDKNQNYVIIDIEKTEIIATVVNEIYLWYNESIVNELR